MFPRRKEAAWAATKTTISPLFSSMVSTQPTSRMHSEIFQTLAAARLSTSIPPVARLQNFRKLSSHFPKNISLKLDDFAESHHCAPRGAPKSMTGNVSH